MKARVEKTRRTGGAVLRVAGTAALMALLAACGGGGGTGDAGAPAPSGSPLGSGLTSGSPDGTPHPGPGPTVPDAPEPAPSEFRVNLTTAGDQGNAAGAALPSGGFAAVWTSAPMSGHGDVRMKNFDAHGRPAGGEIVVAEQGRTPEVVTLADGSVLVTWWANPFALQVNGYGRRFDADGNPLGEPVQLGTASNKFVPRPMASPDGGFVLAADVAHASGPELGRIARYSADGALLGTPTFLASDVSPPVGGLDPNWVRGTVAAGWPDGRFAVAWVAGGTDVSELRLTQFDSQGQVLGTQALMRDSLLQEPAIAVLAGGETVVAWVSVAASGDRTLYVDFLDGDGAGVGRLAFAVEGDTVVPRLAPLADGGVVLGWKAVRHDGGTVHSTARALRVGATGQPAGPPELIGSVSAPAGAPVVEHDSLDVVGLTTGGFIVLHGKYTDESGWDVRGNRR